MMQLVDSKPLLTWILVPMANSHANFVLEVEIEGPPQPLKGSWMMGLQANAFQYVANQKR